MQLGIIWTTFGVWIWIYFSNQLQLTCEKLNLDHINTIHIMWQHKHVLQHFIKFIPWFLCLLDRLATGTGGHPLCWRHHYRTSSARQAAPPLIMSIKTQFPLFLLCMFRMITLCRFLPPSWTHILCMAYHLVTVVSKPQS